MKTIKAGLAGLLIAAATVVPTLGGAVTPAHAYTEEEIAEPAYGDCLFLGTWVAPNRLSVGERWCSLP